VELFCGAVEAEHHDKAECPEPVDQIEAWPEDPEAVDETEIRGRWLNGIGGGIEKSACSASVRPGLIRGCGAEDQLALRSSGAVTGSDLISGAAVEIPCSGIETGVCTRRVSTGGGGGGHCGGGGGGG
jgi:hypothetical protein